jgi:hypothetical protein
MSNRMTVLKRFNIQNLDLFTNINYYFHNLKLDQFLNKNYWYFYEYIWI